MGLKVYFRDGLSPGTLKKFDEEKDVRMGYKKINGDFYVPYPFRDIEREFEDTKYIERARDLLNISVALFFSDKCFPRDNSVEIHIAVREQSLWNTVKPLLRQTLSTLTGETYDFTFHQMASKRPPPKKVNRSHYETVCLFSGGIDSLCGLVSCRNETPLAVSIATSTLLSSVQKELFQKVSTLFALDETQHRIISIRSRNPKNLGKKYKKLESKRKRQWICSMRSRSFLFLSIAAAYAAAKHIQKMYIPENGIMALIDEVPISAAYAGTRTAHPQFLALYEQLISKLFYDITVENPFAQKTKAEVCNGMDIPQEQGKTLLSSTASCSNFSRIRHHCGRCLPCIYRKISLHSTPFKDTHYDFDVFNIPCRAITESWPKGKDKDGYLALLDFIELAYKLKNLPRSELAVQYPILEDDTLYSMYSGFAEECFHSFSKISESYPDFAAILSSMVENKKEE